MTQSPQHLWINLEKNYEHDSAGTIVSAHHVEVYRGYAHEHRVDLRVYFSLLDLFEILRNQKSSKVVTFHAFRPLIIFIWLALVSFSPHARAWPWEDVDAAATSSQYLVMLACTLGFNDVMAAVRMREWGLGGCSACVLAAAAACYCALRALASPLLFPNDISHDIFSRAWMYVCVCV